MEHLSNVADSPSNSSSDQVTNLRGWERFLPERPLRVLLVEDDCATSQVVGALLTKCGYEVSSASDGSEAWDLLQQSNNTFDLVLADAAIPISSGSDLLAKIMSSDVHRDIPVIMMSSHDSIDMVFKCLLKGAKDFLVKPLRKNELRNLWQHVWRRNHLSSVIGSKGGVQGKKRKATTSSSSGDLSNDNFSVSSGLDDHNVCRDENNAQVSGVKKAVTKFKLECDEVLVGIYNEAPCEDGEHLLPAGHRHDFLQDSDGSGRTTETFDFMGTMATDLVPGGADSSKGKPGKPAAEATNKCQASSALDLTLKRCSSIHKMQSDPPGRQGVHQSDHSAFSKYTGKASVFQQQCVAQSASLPNDQGQQEPGVMDSSVEGPQTTLEISCQITERTAVPGNSGPQTLHFPKASHFNHGGMQFGNSPLSLLSSCCEENGRQAAQDNGVSNFWSPSYNSSTANSSLLCAFREAPPVNFDQLGKLGLPKDAHFAGSQVASTWCGSDKEDLGSSNANLGQLSSCTNADCVGPVCNGNYADNLESKPSDSAKEDAAFYDNSCYTMISGRGSNEGSDRGSTLLEENLTVKSMNCSAALDGNSFGGQHLLATNENSTTNMGCSPVTTFNEGNPSDLKPMVYDYQSSFREAALHKFRQKRKLRCFEKKVRYQSRKKLAEQRPRVKGQFVRRVVCNTAAEMKATT